MLLGEPVELNPNNCAIKIAPSPLSGTDNSKNGFADVCWGKGMREGSLVLVWALLQDGGEIL